MAEMTVAQLADVVKIPVETLQKQMQAAELGHKQEEDLVSDDEKQKLLSYLKSSHGAEAAEPAGPKKITLKRKSSSKLKVSVGQGKSKTVNVEVRKKRTYVKRSVVELEVAEKARKADEEKARIEEEAAKEAVVRQAHEEKGIGTKPESEAAKAKRKVVASKSLSSDALKLVEEDAEALERAKKSEDAKKRAEAEARSKAETELAQKTLDDAKRMADELASRGEGSDSPAKPVVEEKSSIVNQAFEKSLTDEDKKIKKAPRKPPRRQKLRSRQVKKPLVSSSSKAHGFNSPMGPVVRDVIIPDTITVSELAQRMSVKGGEVVKALFKAGTMATPGQTVDQATAALIVEELGHTPRLVSDDAIENDLIESLTADVDDNGGVSRAPVVTIMGHVDHGKTSLLDYIRRAHVAEGEAGGITQHIGAYHVDTDKGAITFLDTPGHAAFTAMRARGANCTDIVILVVAADDGMKPQTEEAIDHARAAGVPIVVAVNKIDKEGADPDRVKNELAAKDLIPEDWGGDVQFVSVSAHTGEGVPELLESVSLQSEILELKAAAEGSARGVVIESSLDRGRGVLATLLVQSGELRKGDMVLAGEQFGRVRAMMDESGQQVSLAGTSIPVEILGLAGAPEAGEEFLVVPDERKAREVAEFRRNRDRAKRMERQQAVKLQNALENMGQVEAATVNLVLKTDVRGSLEALTASLNDLSTEEVVVQIVSSGVGGINESDINLALTSGAAIVGFNVRADNAARKLCQEESVELRYYSVIYDLIDDVKKAMSGLLEPELREEILGVANVREVYRSSKYGSIAGCKVMEGIIHRNNPIRVLRDEIVIFQGELESLRRFKDDVAEVGHGIECGIGVKGYNDVKSGDKIEVFKVRKIARTI